MFFGKGQCAECHKPPFYLDHQLHDLKLSQAEKTDLVAFLRQL